METNTYKEIFEEWQQLVCYQDAQLMQDNEWDWEMELQEFVVSPQKALDKAKLMFPPVTDENHIDEEIDDR
jgi:cytochrome c2